MGFPADFGDAVRAARKRIGLSQTELAQRSGVHLNTVSQVERGQADPRLSTMLALSQTLGLSMQVSGMVPMKTYPPYAAPEPLFVREAGNELPAFLSPKKD
jgi:transcriptional regulator with XRE-family HTH domain